MKISTKGRYGLRAMLDLAANYSGEQVSVKSIAERQDISENYLEQVFSALRKAGLVKSVKGAQGGYVLTDVPSKIKLSNILKALEGEISVVEIDGQPTSKTNKAEKVIAELVWDKINECINSILGSLSLEDLLDEYKKLNENTVVMYYI